jgi:hypothetical protein
VDSGHGLEATTRSAVLVDIVEPASLTAPKDRTCSARLWSKVRYQPKLRDQQEVGYRCKKSDIQYCVLYSP